jgi:hypothetical protein
VVFLNDGKGGFGDPQGGFIGYEGYGPVNAPLSGLTSADVNGDGLPDLALIEWNQPPSNFYQLTVLLNTGTGHFAAPVRSDAVDLAISPFFGDFALADFRGTGSPDFLAIGIDGGLTGASYISFAPNIGGGHFGPATITSHHTHRERSGLATSTATASWISLLWVPAMLLIQTTIKPFSHFLVTGMEAFATARPRPSAAPECAFQQQFM